MKTLYFILAVCLTSSLQAELELSAIIADGMVLQRNNKSPVWGWADPDAEVTAVFQDQKTHDQDR